MNRIAITGPESTGKSFLSQQLAATYNTVYVPEMARMYIDSLYRPYEEDDLVKIAQLQLKEEEHMIKLASKYLFCDTELLVIKIWSTLKYGRCHPWILDQLEKKTYDLYLLCDIDLPWEYDPQREHPHLRQYLIDCYIKELETYKFPYALIQGFEDARLNVAVEAIDSFFNKKANGESSPV